MTFSKPNIAIIILAAGSSTRLGTPKQLINYQGKSLLKHVSEIALQSKANSVYVVLGSQISRMKEEVADLNLSIVENPNWQIGISSSIRAGVQALPSSVDAVIMLLCDQPGATPELINQIIETYASTKNDIIACSYGNTVGIPVLFIRKFFPELCSLEDDKGAKSILMANNDSIVTIDFHLGTYDIDTKDDLTLLR